MFSRLIMSVLIFCVCRNDSYAGSIGSRSTSPRLVVKSIGNGVFIRSWGFVKPSHVVYERQEATYSKRGLSKLSQGSLTVRSSGGLHSGFYVGPRKRSRKVFSRHDPDDDNSEDDQNPGYSKDDDSGYVRKPGNPKYHKPQDDPKSGNATDSDSKDGYGPSKSGSGLGSMLPGGGMGGDKSGGPTSMLPGGGMGGGSDSTSSPTNMLSKSSP